MNGKLRELWDRHSTWAVLFVFLLSMAFAAEFVLKELIDRGGL